MRPNNFLPKNQKLYLISIFILSSLFLIIAGFNVFKLYMLYKPQLYEFRGNHQVHTRLNQLLKTDDVIWGFDFLTPKEILFTKRNGSVHLFNIEKRKVFPIEVKGDFAPFTYIEGGLLDLKIKEINNQTYVYMTYSELIEDQDMHHSYTALGRGLYNDKKQTIEQFQKIIEPKSLDKITSLEDKTKQEELIEDVYIRYGSRILFHENKLYWSIGERSIPHKAQDLDFHHGKVLRLNLDGSTPQDNPLKNSKGHTSPVWTYGHRNPQGLTVHPKSKTLWTSEHGPDGGDEINRLIPGQNYGWPMVSLGRDYLRQQPIAKTQKENIISPVVVFNPAVAPSGMTFYNGEVFPEWEDSLFLANLRARQVLRLEFEDDRLIWKERMFHNLNIRFRNVVQGPDEHLYISTDFGHLFRVERAKEAKTIKEHLHKIFFGIINKLELHFRYFPYHKSDALRN